MEVPPTLESLEYKTIEDTRKKKSQKGDQQGRINIPMGIFEALDKWGVEQSSEIRNVMYERHREDVKR